MKVLVSVASKHGATAEIAASISKTLNDRGLDTSLVDPANVVSVKEFDAFVIGSAVYAGRWLKPARKLIKRVGGDLNGRPVWLLSSGPIGHPLTPDEAIDVDEFIAATGARQHQVFAGCIDVAKLNFAEKAMIKAVKAETGDFRDWESITAWSNEVADFAEANALQSGNG